MEAFTLTKSTLLESVIDARAEVNKLRGKYTASCLPVADQKLVRVAQYLGAEAGRIEAAMWADAGFDGVGR